MTAREVINIIESVAPLTQQEGWDNSGLQVGSRETQVAQVLLCTDITDAVVQEAIDKQCQMIISHHPLLFHGLKTIEGLTPQERCVIKALRYGLVLYSSHTAMDCYLHGVSGRMAEKLGINKYHILAEVSQDTGLGVIGRLPMPLSFKEFLKKVKDTFCVPAVRYVAKSSAENKITTVAMCGGAGSEFMDEAIKQGADAYISADFKYHEFQKADGRINVLDIGHFESEQYTKEIFAELLCGKVDCVFADSDKSPIKFY